MRVIKQRPPPAAGISALLSNANTAPKNSSFASKKPDLSTHNWPISGLTSPWWPAVPSPSP